MQEAFLHYIWQYQVFKKENLKTVAGENIEIINLGQHNFDAGPDFLNAQIKINKILWCGNIEIHINASDWDKHKHQNDKAYNNVIVHLVFKYDKNIFKQNKNEIPTIELQKYISQEIIQKAKFINLDNLSRTIACEQNIRDLTFENTHKNLFYQKLIAQRLEDKLVEINQISITENHWEALLFKRLAYGMGLKINNLAFLQWSNSFPFKLVQILKSNPLQLEALFFGQAGMLEENFPDPYFQNLKKEYLFLKHKYKLENVDKSIFKWFRIRPISFPSIKIAQIAAIYAKGNLFSLIMNAQKYSDYQDIFQTKVNPYWEDHFNFGKQAVVKSKNISKENINSLIINVVIPMKYKVGKEQGNLNIDSIFNELIQLKNENNKIIKYFKNKSLKPKNALESQALLQLYKKYCQEKKCLNCFIGHKILNKPL